MFGNRGNSNGGCGGGQEMIDLQKIRGHSSEIIICVDSKTRIQVCYEEDKNHICTVIKKSTEYICGPSSKSNNKKKAPICESVSDQSLDVASAARRGRNGRDPCMVDLMYGGRESYGARRKKSDSAPGNGCEKFRKHSTGVCDQERPPKHDRSSMYHSGKPCCGRGRSRENSARNSKRDNSDMMDRYGGRSNRSAERVRDPYISMSSKRGNERCECSQKDPCKKQKEMELLKKYPCLNIASKQEHSPSRDPCSTYKRDTCMSVKRDPFATRKPQPCDPCNLSKRDQHTSMKRDPCAQPKREPCRSSKRDSCQCSDQSKRKEDPCKRQKEDPCDRSKRDLCKAPHRVESCKEKRAAPCPSMYDNRYENVCAPDPCRISDPCDPCEGNLFAPQSCIIFSQY